MRASEDLSRTVVFGPLEFENERSYLGRTAQLRSGTAPALPRAVPAPSLRLWGFQVFPGHALHEKVLHRQKSNGPLVSNQERRAAVVPRLNHSSTVYFFPHRFK